MNLEKQPKLPTVLWQLIDLVLEDIAKVEADPAMDVDMTTWIARQCNPDLTYVCMVCAAGAVAVNRLGVDPTPCWDKDSADGFYAQLTSHNKDVIWAIDSLRTGHVQTALDELGQRRPEECPERFPVELYINSPTQWREDMVKMRDKLKEFNL